MSGSVGQAVYLAAAVLGTLLIGLSALWGCAALAYRLSGGRQLKSLVIALGLGFTLALLLLLWHHRMLPALVGFAAGLALLLLWWRNLAPSNEGGWADDVARLAAGSTDGNIVTLQNVRNFEWRTASDYTQRWETRHYALQSLCSLDMIMSYWRGPSIAHALFSFGFGGAEYAVFSVEIRRKRAQRFSEIGGFFKQFELAILAADERDIVRLRTNVRREEVYLYRLRLPQTAMRALFLGYIDAANQLECVPRYYNTITVNCTTLVFLMMRRIVGKLPLDPRLLFSGYLPGYVYRIGGLDRSYPLAELRARGRITERARLADSSPTFSADIRAGIPGIEP